MADTVPDYRALSDDDLNILIAHRLGLDVHTSAEVEPGDLFGGMQFSNTREWLDAWIVTADGQIEPLPNVARDLNAAWALLTDIDGARLRVDHDYGALALGQPFEVVIPTSRDEGITVNHELAARACCIARLLYDDREATRG